MRGAEGLFTTGRREDAAEAIGAQGAGAGLGSAISVYMPEQNTAEALESKVGSNTLALIIPTLRSW